MLLIRTIDSVELKAKLFRGLADPSRLSILDALRAGPASVSAVVDATGLSQSNVSNHLSCLRDCGLVVSQQQGRYVFYQLSDVRVGGMLALAEELLADVAQGLYACTRYQGDTVTGVAVTEGSQDDAA